MFTIYSLVMFKDTYIEFNHAGLIGFPIVVAVFNIIPQNAPRQMSNLHEDTLNNLPLFTNKSQRTLHIFVM